VGVERALARAIVGQLDSPTSRDRLLHRAEHFSVDGAVHTYLAALDAAVSRTAVRQ
jgi:hypothetical protein